ncbi:DUF1294 domain-containing protein [Streptococcus suis]|nr:DUF1294 domain-containing protein [Streptococcus suis]
MSLKGLAILYIFLCDKVGKARKNAYRISEKTLLLMSYFGGGLGAWAGGTHFRHKTQKKYFQLAWAIGVLIDAVIMYWMWK